MQAHDITPIGSQPTVKQLLRTFRSPTRRFRFERDHAARKPSWRFDLAGEFVEIGRRAPSRRTDAMLATVFDFLRRYDRRRDDADLEALGPRYPDLTRAFALYIRGGLNRSELEARLLARQSDDEVAAAMNIPSGTVAAYEAAFFNVRDRLNSPYFILLQAIPNHFERLLESDTATILKLFGYFMGPVVLDVMLKHAVDEAGRLRSPQLASLKTEDERLAARAQTAVAAMVGTADPKRMVELLGVQQKVIQEADRLVASAQASRGTAAVTSPDRIAELVEFERGTATEAAVMGDDLDMPSEPGHDGTGSHEAA